MAKNVATLQQARQHFEAGRLDQARILLMRALQRQPGDPQLSNGLATVLSAMGQLDQAIFHARRAAEGMPGQPGPLVNIGNSLLLMGKVDGAEAAFKQAMSIAPKAAEPRMGLGNIYRMRHQFSTAVEVLGEGIAHNPQDPDLGLHYSTSLLHMGRIDEAIECIRQLLEVHPRHPGLLSRLANALNYAPQVSREEILEAHQRYSAALESHIRPMTPRLAEGPDRPLRLGILSYDLRRHSVAFFLEPLVKHLDRDSLVLYCYSTSAMEDDVTARFREHADHWRSAGELDNAKLAAQIRSDAIDVLVETSGHTHGHRMPLMAMRPAPLQATFIGYPNTTGMRTIDLRIVDSMTDPPGSEAFCTERLIRLDPCFLCYAPPPEAPDVGPPPSCSPSASGAAFTFGSFNTMQKVNDAVIRIWLEVLERIPGSRLLLKARDFREDPVRQAVAERFVQAGGDPARIMVVGPAEAYRDHLAAYGQVDVALDTFPYSGTTTTFEALWMGVPVITLEGQTHAARVSTSILKALQLDQCIASTPDDYIECAARLAADAESLKKLRASLRDRLRTSVLTDGAAYAKRFEELIREQWRQACRKETAQ